MKILIVDRLGGIASITCVLHCLVVSLGVSFFSIFELGAEHHEAVEWLFFSSAIVFALLSSIFGYRAHKNRNLMVYFGLGIVILTMGRLAEALELFEGGDILAIAGGGVIFISHVWSTRCCSLSEEIDG